MRQIIKEVKEGSIGQELGLEKGDSLLSINGRPIQDVLDYLFLCEGETITLQILTKDGQEVECEVEKEEDEPLGLVFEEEFMGQYKHCENHCIFCFIDQMPKGMRKSLYFKDDDSRLSFLDGNYITMTNMKDEDFQKIIDYHLSPINISVHTTNPDLRVSMLKNPKAAFVMERMRKLRDAEIMMNAQIVLCRHINDGAELDRTLHDLMTLRPYVGSVSIVPVGLSRFREKLYPLEPFTREDLGRVIDQVEPYRQYFYQKDGDHFVHLSDEFYLGAGRPLPSEEAYDGYPQLENGVGMMRSFLDEALSALAKTDKDRKVQGHLSVATGVLASGGITDICRQAEEKFPHLKVDVHVVTNHFFGDSVTVSGLLTGQDLIAQLKGKDLGQRLLLPGNMFKQDEALTLDDMSVSTLSEALHIPICIVKSSGSDFISAIMEAGQPAI